MTNDALKITLEDLYDIHKEFGVNVHIDFDDVIFPDRALFRVSYNGHIEGVSCEVGRYSGSSVDKEDVLGYIRDTARRLVYVYKNTPMTCEKRDE